MASSEGQTRQKSEQRCSPEVSATAQNSNNVAPESPTRLDDVVAATQEQAATHSQNEKTKESQQAQSPGIDDDVVGKVYDSRLMRRLFRYLSPYKLQAIISAVAILIKSGSDVFGPYLVKVAVDTYLAPTPGKHSWLSHYL